MYLEYVFMPDMFALCVRVCVCVHMRVYYACLRVCDIYTFIYTYITIYYIYRGNPTTRNTNYESIIIILSKFNFTQDCLPHRVTALSIP